MGQGTDTKDAGGFSRRLLPARREGRAAERRRNWKARLIVAQRA